MVDNKYITLFTARIGKEDWDVDANIKLFDEKERITEVSTLEFLFSIKYPNQNEEGWRDKAILKGICSCFDGMDLESRIELIKEAATSPDADERFSKGAAKAIDKLKESKGKWPIPDQILKTIWKNKSEVLIENAEAPWSIYRVKNHPGVYVIDILDYKIEESVWIPGLYQLAQKLDPDAGHITIAFHQKDTKEDHDDIQYTYVFPEDKVSKLLGEDSNNRVSVLSFSHTVSCPVYLLLLDSYHSEDTSIDKTVDIVHRKISQIKNNTKLFLTRMKVTTNSQGGSDPIGNSYKQLV